MITKKAILLVSMMILGGCAAQPQKLYQWGEYEERLYAGYKDPNQMQTLMVKLEAHILEREQSRGRVAPGLYAELGTLYLQGGDKQRASALYSKERATWPESSALMSSLIVNLEEGE